VIRKLIKILLYILTVLILLLVISYAALQSNSVQTWLTQKIGNYLSEKLNAKITVDAVDISFFNNVILHGVYVEDQNKDTLLFVHRLEAGINSLSFSDHRLGLQKITLNGSYTNIYSDSSGVLNLQFILDEFRSQDTAKPGWDIECGKLCVENSGFSYRAFGHLEKKHGVNFKDITATEINFILDDIKVYKDSVAFLINDLSLRERSGFSINGLSSAGSVNKTNISLSDLHLVTEKTDLSAKALVFKYKNKSDFKDFIGKVRIDALIDSSKVSLSDISFFAPDLKDLHRDMIVSGRFKGKVSDLKAKDLIIHYGDRTRICGSVNIIGLPDINETFIYANIKDLITDRNDIESIPLFPPGENRHVVLPSYLGHLSLVRYKGKFTGFVNDFVAYGNFSTNLGSLSSDLSLKKDINNRISFSGKVITKELDIGKLSGNDKYIGKLSMNTGINGFTTPDNKVQAMMEGEIRSIEINKYDYKNVKIEGELTNRKFDGALSINDPNIAMEFLGRFDFTDKIPVFDFTADVSGAKLYRLNLEKEDSLSTASFLLTANFVGDSIDNVDGKIDMFRILYKKDTMEMDIDEFHLSADRNKQDSVRTLIVRSDVVDAEIKGKYRFRSLYRSVVDFINNYLPSFGIAEKNMEKITKNDFRFDIKLKETKQVSDIFASYITVQPNTTVSGDYDSEARKLKISGQCPGLFVYGNDLEDLSIDGYTSDNKLFFVIESASLISGDLRFDNPRLNSITQNDSIQMSLNWHDGEHHYSGDILSCASFSIFEGRKKTVITVDVFPSNVVIADTVWNISKSKFVIDSTSMHVFDVGLNNKNQYMYINGIVSDNRDDTLSVTFNNINLSNLNLLTKSRGFEINGVLDGQAKLTDYYHRSLFYSDINIQYLVVNKEVLGNTYITSKWDKQEKKLNIDAYAKRGKINTISIKGDYFPGNNSLAFDISLDKLRLNILDPYFRENVSDIRGIASGDLTLSGTPAKPLIEGRIKLQKTSFFVNYLQTRYNFNSDIDITGNSFDFNNVTLFDMYGNTSVVNGSINHKHFKDINYDISILASNFLFLNTKEKDNSLYYGKAFASGIANIKGTPKDIIVEISATTEKDTRFFIPLESGEEVIENDFITIVDHQNGDKEISIEEEYNVDLSGIRLKFDFEVTPDAEVQIILDEKVGDIIRGRGSGNLNMEINTLGKFNMYGEYVIEHGDYLFTLQNVINKRFDIERGGTISWNGDPYDANINLDAIYRLKTSLYPLTLDSTYKHRTPVECMLNMTGKLMSPNIRFGIRAPLADDNTLGIINSLSEDETNKQVLSLLVLNSFFTPDSRKGGVELMSDNKSAGFGVGANTSELLSNQLSHWLSQISNDFDIGVNYRPGDEISSDEIEVALSTQILNDRVSINGNVGVGEHQTTTSNIVGDFDVDVKINKSGKLRVKGFNKANDNMVYNTSPYTQGLGIFYKEDFNTIKELWRRYFGKKK